jgi:hypothetical protein
MAAPLETSNIPHVAEKAHVVAAQDLENVRL